MFGIENFLAFLLAGILLNLTPGSDTMYVLGRSISQGRLAGIYSALGIGAGCLVHIFLATFGLSVIIKNSQMLFDLIKYAGAAYLFYLGVKMLINKDKQQFNITKTDETTDLKKVFLSGAVTNVLNPKVALFFIAFLPQFVQKDYPHPALSFFILGLTFNFTGTVWNLILAVFAASMTTRIKENYRIKTGLDRLTGIVFIALGIRLALAKNR
ncbi:MAG: LysE family translocator [Saprospiraceae bacterium]|nr:LysE family translocator [Saprospiraceae bacterium]